MSDSGENFSIERVSQLPTCAGIYAIVNTINGHRYVGQAFNIRERILGHIRDLDAGRERTNAEMILQKAWLEYGRGVFVILVLEVVENNRESTQYDIRPDNLALAEHFYINEKGEYNKDRRIVSDRFKALIEEKAWRLPIDEETKSRLAAASPRAYLVAKRIVWEPAVVVLAFSEKDAKREAAARDEAMKALGGNLSTRRLSADGVARAIADGALDCRDATASGHPWAQ
jgi:hypothetical protein